MMSETEELGFLTQEGMFLKSRVLNWKRETKEMKKKRRGEKYQIKCQEEAEENTGQSAEAAPMRTGDDAHKLCRVTSSFLSVGQLEGLGLRHSHQLSFYLLKYK